MLTNIPTVKLGVIAVPSAAGRQSWQPARRTGWISGSAKRP